MMKILKSKRIITLLLAALLIMPPPAYVSAASGGISILYSVFFDEYSDGSSVPYTLRASGVNESNRLSVTGGKLELCSDGTGSPAVEFRTGAKPKALSLNFSVSVDEINSDVALWITDYDDNEARLLLFTARGDLKAADGASLSAVGMYEKHKNTDFSLAIGQNSYSVYKDGEMLAEGLMLPTSGAENKQISWYKNIKSFRFDTFNYTGASTRVSFGSFAVYEGVQPYSDADLKQYIKDEELRREQEAEKPPEEGPEIYANNNFNDYEEGDTKFGIGGDKKGNLEYIAAFPDEDNKSLCLESVCSDTFNALTSFSAAQKGQFVWDMSVYFADLQSKATLTLRDPTPLFIDTVKFLAGGQIRNLADETIGAYTANKWYRIQLLIDVEHKSYTVYIDGNKLVDNQALPDSIKSVGLVRFHIYPPSGGGSRIYLDNWRIYEGAELLSDEYLDSRSDVTAGSHYIDHAKMESKFNNMTVFRADAPYYYSSGSRVSFDAENRSVKTFSQDGEIMLPLRAWIQSRGGGVSWDNGEIGVQTQSFSANINAASGQSVINGEPFTFTTVNRDGSVYVPVSFAAKAEGLTQTQYGEMMVLTREGESFDFGNDANYANEMGRYLLFDHPSEQQIIETLLTRYPNNEHPRIMVEPDSFERINSLVETDENMAKWYASLKKSADAMLTAAAITYTPDKGDTLLESARTMLSRAKTLGLMYNLTGDTAYKDALWSNVQTVCAFPDWYPTHFLDVGEMSMAVAIAYDWVYNDWTKQQRRIMENALESKGLEVTLEQYETDNQAGYWTVTDNNWNIVCNGGAAVAALAIGEKNPELCGKVVHYALWGLESMMKEYAPDGGWNEGVTYWQYATSYFTQLMSALNSALGNDYGFMESPGVERTGEFVIQATGPSGIFNFHDAGNAFYSSPEILYMSSRLNKPELTVNNLYTRAIYGLSGGAAEMIWYNPDMNTEMAEEIPKDSVFTNIQTAFMRNDFEDANGMFVGLHGGKNNVNHGQLDNGNFIVDAIGQRWFIDLGGDNYSLPEYFAGKRYNYYRNRAEGHNTLVINPSSEADQIPAATGVITKQFSKPRGAFSVLDMTDAYTDAQSLVRAVMLGNDRSVVTLRDEIKLTKSSELYWFAHTTADINISEDKKSALLTIGNKQMYVQLDSDMDAEFSVMAAKPLESSPQHSGQNANSGVQKLAIHLNNVREGYIQVSFVPVLIPSEGANTALIPPPTPISEWESLIPDGEYAPMCAENIYVDGEPIENFEKSNAIYTIKYPYGTTEPPVISAEAGGYDVKVEQAVTMPGTATVRITDPNDSARTKLYLIELNVLPQIGVKPEGSREAVPAEVSASAVPQPENTPENTLDNDLDTRWSAFGVQWIQYDLGDVYDVTNIELAWYGGNGRVYPFEIHVSTDGENFETLMTGANSATSNELEMYQLPPTAARYVRVKGFGNSVNEWCSLSEAKIYVKE